MCPTRASGPPRTAIIAGDVQLMFNNVATALPHVQAGKLAALGSRRAPSALPALPDLPAVAETVPGFEMAPWVGIFAPAKTPKEIVDRLEKEVLALHARSRRRQDVHRPAGQRRLRWSTARSRELIKKEPSSGAR